MTTSIKKQHEIMAAAIKMLDDIDTVNSLIGPMDTITAKVLTTDLRIKYIDLMMELQVELLKANTTGHELA